MKVLIQFLLIAMVTFGYGQNTNSYNTYKNYNNNNNNSTNTQAVNPEGATQAQAQPQQPVYVDAFAAKLPLNQQFDFVFNTNNTYVTHKLVYAEKFKQLKSSALDTIINQKKILLEKQTLIDEQSRQIDDIQQELAGYDEKLDDAIGNKDKRSLFGLNISKNIFSILIGISYVILLSLLGFFAFKYQHNLSNTNKAISEYEALANEYEAHKKSSLAKIQEVSRKLQDELNKQWKGEK